MIPHEKALVKRLEKEPFALVGINTDTSKDEYKKKAVEMGVTWRSSWQGSTSGPLCREWSVTSFPTVYVLDASGKIRYIGVRDKALEQAVDHLLDELRTAKNAPAGGSPR